MSSKSGESKNHCEHLTVNWFKSYKLAVLNLSIILKLSRNEAEVILGHGNIFNVNSHDEL
ncbi:hypothetical protein MASR1M74_13290 [Lentimicrobium sp.]